MPSSPERELEEFLKFKELPVTLAACIRKDLRKERMSPDEAMEVHMELINAMADGRVNLGQIEAQYYALLEHVPIEWEKQYERKAARDRELAASDPIPKRKPGRKPKLELAKEAAKLLQQRPTMNYPQLATELNKSLPKEHQITPDAIRKLLKRHS